MMAFKYISVKPDVKSKIAILKVKWGLKTEGEVIERLFDRASIGDSKVEHALDLIEFIKRNP